MAKLVSIIVVTHRRRAFLLRCLKSCLEQDYPALEIVVLLNPDDPETEAVVNQEMPSVKVVRTHRNLGAFPAKNLAVVNSDGEYVFMMDDDAYFMTRDVISKLVRATELEPELGAVTCNIEGPRETTLSGDDRYVHVFKDGFTLFHRQVFTEWVGYYPDLFFRSAGETFLATGLWNLGYRIKCLVNVRMFHDMAMEGRSDHDWKFYGMRSQALCAVIREPWFIVPPSLISKFFKSFINFVKWGHVQTWFRVWWSILVHIPEVIPDRRPVSWSTYKLMRRLQTEVITDAAQLPHTARLADLRPELPLSGKPPAAPNAAGALQATVVITTRNRKDELRGAIESALKQSVPVEVMVMDDASTDGSAEMVRRDFPQVRIYSTSASTGYIVQRNRAAELATTPFIFSLDDDAVFSSAGVVEQTLREFESARTGAVAIPFINVRSSPELVQPKPPDRGVYITDSFIGTAYALRRELFRQLGGFREVFVHQGEEGDYCLRMLNAGYVTRVGRADPVHHFESPRRDFVRVDYYGRRNLIVFAWANVPGVRLPVHLVATSLNGLFHGIRVGRPRMAILGLLAGLSELCRGKLPRLPVSATAYRLSRRLKKNGYACLSTVAGLLPAPMEKPRP